MSGRPDIEIIDISDEASFGRIPPCADASFDHRSCDYWEDEVRGSKTSRPSWWQEPSSQPAPPPRRADPDNPFAGARSDEDDFNPFASTAVAAALDPLGGDDLFATPAFNPFAPTPDADDDRARAGGPRKLRLLDRGRAVFGSYAKILLLDAEPSVYVQFGPLSAYPRAQQIRELYPRLPQSPLPAVITCVATVRAARGQGLGASLIAAVCDDLAGREFAAVEAYPDLTLTTDEASAANPAFWDSCGFTMAAADERYPVMRRALV